MKRKCEDCGEIFEGGEYARYCRKCRMQRMQAGVDRRMAEVRAAKETGTEPPKPKKKWNPSRFTCESCAKLGTTCKAARKGTHDYCWVSLDGETAQGVRTKPKKEILPPAAPRALPKRERPRDRIGLYRQLAEDAGLSYGAWVAATPEAEREAAWRKFRAEKQAAKP